MGEALWRPSTIVQWQQHRPCIGEGGADAEPAQRGVGETSPAWKPHGERNLYDNEWVRLSLVDVELPDGRRYEHHVVSMKPAAMTALLDDAGERVLLMWRHRFAADVWNWELPGGLLEPDATLMDAAGLSARAAADQLGHAEVSMTTDHYFGRRIAATGAARVLEAVADPASAASRDEKESAWVNSGCDLAESGGRARDLRVCRPPGARTRNPRIKSPLLYPLS